MDGHSKLEFIDIKTNITSILLSLHRFDKKTATKIKIKTKTDKMEIYKIKTKKKTMAASLLVSGNLQKCVCPFLIERESEKKKS